jgi:hypothetical protein
VHALISLNTLQGFFKVVLFIDNCSLFVLFHRPEEEIAVTLNMQMEPVLHKSNTGLA